VSPKFLVLQLAFSPNDENEETDAWLIKGSIKVKDFIRKKTKSFEKKVTFSVWFIKTQKSNQNTLCVSDLQWRIRVLA